MILLTQRKSLFLSLSKHHNQGFTLPETLLVIMVWMVLVLILSPLHHTTMESIESKQFFNQFESDLLLAQQLTMQKHDGYHILFRKSKNDYILYDRSVKQTVFVRTLPKDWSYQMNTMTSTIRFKRSGTIRHPGTMRFYTPEETYKVTFPFGTSRVKIDEL